VLSYRFRRAGYARPSTNGLVIEDRYDLPDLTRRYARLATRTVPMLLPYSIDEQITVKLTVPEGLSLDGPGDDSIEYGSDFGSYSRNVTRDARQLQIVHRLVLAQQRIDTKRYRDFATWAGDVDRATYGRVVVRPESASVNTR